MLVLLLLALRHHIAGHGVFLQNRGRNVEVTGVDPVDSCEAIFHHAAKRGFWKENDAGNICSKGDLCQWPHGHGDKILALGIVFEHRIDHRFEGVGPIAEAWSHLLGALPGSAEVQEVRENNIALLRRGLGAGHQAERVGAFRGGREEVVVLCEERIVRL